VGDGRDQIALADLVDPPQPGAPRSASLAHVGEGSFDSFAALALQSFAALAAGAAAIRVHRVALLGRLVGPGVRASGRQLPASVP